MSDMYKVDAMDIDKRHIKALEKLLIELRSTDSGGICIPIKAKMHYENKEIWYDEWQISENWDNDKP